MIGSLFKRIGPIAALTLGATVAGCGSVDMKINGQEGVPLSEVDMSGDVPTELVVSANAKVVVTEGDTLEITVENDDEDALRFVRDDGLLGVTLDPDREIRNGNAIVRVTMGAPESIVIAGAGSVESDSASANPEIAIGGSGEVSIKEFAAETLEVTIGGSGSVTGAGRADRLEVAIGGAGSVNFAELTTDKAEVTIGGSGDVAFMSDGEVDASIAGSGDINVTGDAKCTVNSLGSGTLTCNRRAETSEPVAEIEAD